MFSMPTVHLKLFAGVRDAVGARDLSLDVPPGARVADLEALVVARHPAVARWRGRLLVSVNREMAAPDRALADGDEVALMPPVSGGATQGPAPAPGRLHEGPLSLDAVLAEMGTAGAGCAVAFLGLVRAGPSKWVPGESVERLEFEAYEPMAEAELTRVTARARERFGLVDARILHRIGTLQGGEPIVLVLVTAPHRDAAFDAARWIMEELKTVVPIWKQEVYADGTRHWVEEGGKRDA